MKVSILLRIIVLIIILSCPNESSIDNPRSARIYDFLSHGLASIIYKRLLSNSSHGIELSSQCKTSIGTTIDGLKNGHEWAFRLLDSSSKKPTGFTGITLGNLGDYDACLQTVSDRGDGIEIHGQHCAIESEYM